MGAVHWVWVVEVDEELLDCVVTDVLDEVVVGVTTGLIVVLWEVPPTLGSVSECVEGMKESTGTY